MSIQINTSGRSPTLQSKTVNSSTTNQTIYPDSRYDGLSSVQINKLETSEETFFPWGVFPDEKYQINLTYSGSGTINTPSVAYRNTYNPPLNTITHYKYYYITIPYASLNASQLYNDGNSYDIIKIPFPNSFGQILSFYLVWYNSQGLSFTCMGFWHIYDYQWKCSTGNLIYGTETIANTKLSIDFDYITFYSNSQISGFSSLNKNGNCLLQAYVI